MQYAIIARDDTAPGTLEKRLAVRQQHLDRIHALKADGTIIDGGAILDDGGRMTGSVVLCEFADRAGLDDFLSSEIYVRDGVWKDIEIIPFKRVPWT